MLSNEEICDIVGWHGEGKDIRLGDVTLTHYPGRSTTKPHLLFYSPSKEMGITVRNNFGSHSYIGIELVGGGVERGYGCLVNVPEPARSFIEKVLLEYKEYKEAKEKDTERIKKKANISEREEAFKRGTQKLMSKF